jgi:hypothetical protein
MSVSSHFRTKRTHVTVIYEFTTTAKTELAFGSDTGTYHHREEEQQLNAFLTFYVMICNM